MIINITSHSFWSNLSKHGHFTVSLPKQALPELKQRQLSSAGTRRFPGVWSNGPTDACTQGGPHACVAVGWSYRCQGDDWLRVPTYFYLEGSWKDPERPRCCRSCGATSVHLQLDVRDDRCLEPMLRSHGCLVKLHPQTLPGQPTVSHSGLFGQ